MSAFFLTAEQKAAFERAEACGPKAVADEYRDKLVASIVQDAVLAERKRCAHIARNAHRVLPGAPTFEQALESAADAMMCAPEIRRGPEDEDDTVDEPVTGEPVGKENRVAGHPFAGWVDGPFQVIETEGFKEKLRQAAAQTFWMPPLDEKPVEGISGASSLRAQSGVALNAKAQPTATANADRQPEYSSGEGSFRGFGPNYTAEYKPVEAKSEGDAMMEFFRGKS